MPPRDGDHSAASASYAASNPRRPHTSNSASVSAFSAVVPAKGGGRSPGGRDRPPVSPAGGGRGKHAGAEHLRMPSASARQIGTRQGATVRVKQSKSRQIVANAYASASTTFAMRGCPRPNFAGQSSGPSNAYSLNGHSMCRGRNCPRADPSRRRICPEPSPTREPRRNAQRNL